MENIKQETEQSKNSLPEYLKMYEISGQDAITEHSFLRYQKDKEISQTIIEELVQKSASAFVQKIVNTPKEAVADLLKQGLSSGDSEIAKECALRIYLAPEYERGVLREQTAEIVEKGFANGSAEEKRAYAEMIQDAPSDKISDLVKTGLTIGDPEAKIMCAQTIKFAPKEERASLIRAGLESGNPAVQKECLLMIRYTPDSEETPLREHVASVIEQGLASGKAEIQSACAEMIPYVSDEEKTPLREQIAAIIKNGFASGDKTDQKYYASMIEEVSRDLIAPLVAVGLMSGNAEVQNECARMIYYAPKDKKEALKEETASIIEQGYTNTDKKSKKVYAQMIEYAAEEKRAPLIQTGIMSKNQELGKACAEMIFCAPKNTRKELFELAKNKLGNALITHPLYKNTKISNDAFSRQRFPKTGSETTLIGGELKNKTTLRHIESDSFLVWQKLYEDHELWEKEGFDYVPVEPIQSFSVNKDNLVDVASGVLDISFAKWQEMTDDFSDELLAERSKILKVLNYHNMKHGHTHDNNFCLRFFRDENDNVDFNKKPRIYLIDFDEAWTPG